MVLVCVNPLDSALNAYVKQEPQRIETNKISTEVEVVVKEVPVKISAYYAPTPNQDGEYATGSYAGDVRLNGRGRVTKFKGQKPRENRTIAADPNVFPPGTKLRIYDPKLPIEKRVYRYIEVEDGGGAIKGNKIDIYMGKGKFALRRALKWGKKRMIAEVIEKREVIILAQR
jgi:3D (Asp-Asp-Asp) domain-containing protein